MMVEVVKLVSAQRCRKERTVSTEDVKRLKMTVYRWVKSYRDGEVKRGGLGKASWSIRFEEITRNHDV
jgi:hypothetical protein